MTRLAALILSLALTVNASALNTAKPVQPAYPVVNINTATLAQLCYLPGVGPKTAQAIIDGRPLVRVAFLGGIKGIGPKKLAKMAPYVVVTGKTTATAKIRVPKVVTPAPVGKSRCGPGARCAG